MQLIYLKKTQLLVLTLILGTVIALDNFQQRCVYYNDKDSVCSGGAQQDFIHLYFNLSDQRQIRKETGWGYTNCEELDPHPSTKITTHSSWSFVDQKKGYKVRFSQQDRRIKNWFGKLDKLIVNATLSQSLCKIQFLDYNCSVIGDGTIQHFGVEYNQYQPAQIHLQCQRIWNIREQ